MAGRRLTISALLCADEQPPDGAHPTPTSSHSTPLVPPSPKPDIASADLRDSQVNSLGSVEPHSHAVHSYRPYPEYNRDSHNSVPLSLQHVHLRRHTPSPSGGERAAYASQWGGHGDYNTNRPETLASNSRPLVSPPVPRSIPTSRRISDPRESEYRPSESPSYFSRPTSSRSVLSDPQLATYTYPPPLPRPSFSHSPQQSPDALYNVSPARQASHSPVLGRLLSRSPTNLYRPMSQSTPHSDSQQSPYSQRTPNPSQSPSVLFGPASPSSRGDEPFGNHPSRLRSASQTQSGSPPFSVSRTSSATALPNLLNAEPPRSPAVAFGSHGSPGGLGALEALVQAATEERRRLSGELPTPLERKESARRASLSPVLNRNPPLPPVSHSPVLQKSPPLPSPRLDARVNSLAFISFGQTPSQDGEPPTKRRRRTGSFNAHLPALPEPVPVPPIDPAASTSVATPSPAVGPAAPVALEAASTSATEHPTSPRVSSTPALPPPVQSPTTLASSIRSHPRSAPDRLFVDATVPTIPPATDSALATTSSTPEQAIPSPPTPPRLLATSKPISISQLLVNEPPISDPPVVGNAVQTAVPREPPLDPVPMSSVAPAVEHPIPPTVEEPSMAQAEEPTIAQTVEERSMAPTVDEPPIVPAVAGEPSQRPDEKAAVDILQPGPSSSVVESVSHAQSASLPVPEEEDEDEELMKMPPLAGTEMQQMEEVKMEEVQDASLVTSEALPPSPKVAGESGAAPTAHTAGIPPEQDAHEWLLEHYATDSPASASRRVSPAPEAPPDSPESSVGSPPPQVKPEEVQMMPIVPGDPVDDVLRTPEPAQGRSRTPTPLALLEEELDRATPDERIVPHKAASPNSDADLAMELDLAASASGQAVHDVEMSTSNDLDDELLSLLDEKPRHPHSHPHPHPHPHSHSHSHSHAQAHAQAHTHGPSHTQPHPMKAAHASPSSTRSDKPPQDQELLATKAARSSEPPASAAPTPSERVVMPPPIAPPGHAAKTPVANQQPTAKPQKADAAVVSSSSKKKESAPKPAPKAKPPAKPKAKAATVKPKAKTTVKEGTAGSTGRLTPSGSGTVAKGKKTAATNATAASAAKRSVSAAVGQSRSRSASVMPAPPEPASKPQEEEEEEEAEEVDDKLYCICKTSYDEDKVMIACDRCDEWYHTQCLNMNDLEVDLIDQFVCPPCIKANPHLPLKTTYKQRCFAGLKHPRPSSAAACHKPARGAFSKFCSDDCGIAYMQRRIENWGGEEAALWASVRDVKQREGVVVKVQLVKEEPKPTRRRKAEQRPAGELVVEHHEVQRPSKTQRERAIARLQGELLKLAPKREILKEELEVVLWRQKVLELAAARAERVQECGWDQRLCLDDEEYVEYAAGILESYEEGHAHDGADAMPVDGTGVEDGAWWCRGKKKCQRHAGWQKLRANELEFDQELKEKAMSALTTQEREIRRHLEDVISLESRQRNIPSVPLQALNGHTQGNGAVKSKTNGTSQKKGKQKN